MFEFSRVSLFVITWLTCGFGLIPPARAGEGVGPDAVSADLFEIRQRAFGLAEDARELELFTRSNADWQSHAGEVKKIREDVESMKTLAAGLANQRAQAAAWQQPTIDHVAPVAAELASGIISTIQLLSEHPNRATTPAYQEYVSAFADSVTNLSSMITDFVDYGTANQRLQSLREKLGSTAGNAAPAVPMFSRSASRGKIREAYFACKLSI
jgi:hypothetical protein